MIDIKFLRENPEAVKENIKKKFQDSKLPLVDEVIDLDAKSRAAKQEADELRAQRNKLSKQIGALMGQGKKEEAEEVKVLYRVIGEFESLGDSGENISRILDRERVHNRKLDVEMISKINLMIDKVDVAYTVMNENLRTAVNGSLKDISNAYNAEDDINETRNKLREEGIIQIERHTGNYQSLNYFLDIISELEAMGDFMINVSQSIVRNDG